MRAALSEVGTPIAKFSSAEFNRHHGNTLSNMHTEAINSRQLRVKIGVASVFGLLLLAALCALSAQFGAGYWGGCMLMALAFLPL
jgi:hypothetical protein